MVISPLQPILVPFMLKSSFKESNICDKDGYSLTVRSPHTVHEMEEIQKLYRKAAESSDGFAIDEFTETGLINQRILRDVTVTGVFSPEGAVVAAATFGKSAIPRIPGKCIGGYIVVTQANRHRGIGTKLLHMIEKYTEDMDLDDLIFDVFVSSQHAIQWLSKEGYVITGTIPNSGVILNKGFTDTVIMYKSLNRTIESFPLKKSSL